MPSYKITDEQGKSLKVTGNAAPTEEQIKKIFSDYYASQPKQKVSLTDRALGFGITPFGKSDQEIQNEINEQRNLAEITGAAPKEYKYTEETLSKDPKWIESAKQVYQLNEGAEAKGLESDDDYAKYALDYMGWFNYNLPKMGWETAQLTQATDEQKNAFVNLMDMYDQKKISLAGTGRFIKGVVTDPSILVGGGLGAQAIKQGIRAGVKEATKAGLKSGAKAGVYEGTAYAVADNALRQSARMQAGQQDSFDPMQSLKSAALGATLGGALGGTVGGISGYRAAKNKLDDVITREQSSIEDPKITTKEIAQEVKPVIQKEITQEKEALVSPSTRTQPTLKQELEEITQPLPDIELQPYQFRPGLFGEAYQKKATSIIDSIKKPFVRFSPLKTLPEQKEYLTLRGLTGGKLTRVKDITRKVFDTFSELSPENNFAARRYLTKEADIGVIKNKDLQEKAKDLRRGIDYIGDSLVRSGILEKETVEANKGSYLPRVYLKYLDKKSAMGYTKARKDMSDETIEFLGEVTDISQQGARAIEDPMTDIVQYQMFEKVFNNPKWTLQSGLVDFQGKKVSPVWLKQERDRVADEITGNLRPNKDKKIVKEFDDLIDQANANIQKEDLSLYKQMPDSKQYGVLRGAYVRKEIYDDLLYAGNVSDNWFRKIFGQPGKLAKLTKWFKFSKVALNPPSQIRNASSNIILLDLSGIPAQKLPKRILEAVQDMSKNGPYTQIARKYGIIDSTFAKQEMVELNKLYRKLKAQETKNAVDAARYYGSIIGDWAGNVYQTIEIIGKTTKIIDEMKRGVDEANAAFEAQKSLFDYSLVPASVKDIRTHSLGIPFMTFYYKVLPNLLESAIRYPEKYVKYLAIPTAAAAYVASTKDVSIDDVNKLKEAMPKWIRDKGSAFLLPFKDENGKWQVFDFSYFLPWSMFTGIATDVKEGELSEALRQTGALGGPIPQLITAWTTNIDPFTQREISNDADPAEKQLQDKLNYLYRTAMPTWLTDIGFAGKLKQAIDRDVNKFGDPKITKTQAMMRLFGVNLYSIDPQKSRLQNIKSMDYEIQQIKARRTQTLKDKNLTPTQRKEIAKEYSDRIRERLEQRKEYVQASEIPKELL